mmetsp:Transcript_23566/g.57082  ORF Transcript_23566/g.57082 Transcript_23566/m.57082 type:complete len:348 (-) Transcript_23566:221-1264(-)
MHTRAHWEEEGEKEEHSSFGRESLFPEDSLERKYFQFAEAGEAKDRWEFLSRDKVHLFCWRRRRGPLGKEILNRSGVERDQKLHHETAQNLTSEGMPDSGSPFIFPAYHGQNDQYYPQPWVKLAIVASILLWIPVVFKLARSHNLGCGEMGCNDNVRKNAWQTLGHIAQGILTAIALSPWIIIETRFHMRRRLGYRRNDVNVGEGVHSRLREFGSGRREHLTEVVCDGREGRWKWLIWVKNVGGAIGLSAYPIYNLAKRWCTSKTVRHPESFFMSTFFLNQMVFAVSLDSTLIAVGLGLLFVNGTQARSFFPDLSCNHASFAFSAVFALTSLSAVLVLCVVLSYGGV